MSSKVLLLACKINLFTLLSERPLAVADIKEKIGFNERGIYDFLDALVSLGFLNRNEGIRETSVYSNTEISDTYLVNTKPNYLGGFVTMCNFRIYSLWGNLEEALKTG